MRRVSDKCDLALVVEAADALANIADGYRISTDTHYRELAAAVRDAAGEIRAARRAGRPEGKPE